MSKGPFVAVVAVLFAIYVAAAPYLTVHQMKSAAENSDGEALSEHIDFPSVRQSLKDQMNAMLIKDLTTDETKHHPMAELGAVFSGVMVDKLVDAYVTPAGLTQLMAGETPSPEGEEESGGGSGCQFLSRGTLSYESLDKFVVRAKDDNGEECKLVLRRRGIGWKLTEVIIPLDE
jgi:hypothetical protein